jgi:translation initiation factor 5B
VKIENPGGDAPKMFGRHFDEIDLLISRVSIYGRGSPVFHPFFLQISRESIDACKDYFRDELAKSDWALMVELKKLFEIL